MKHIAGICDPSPSHVKHMAAIGRELRARGHRFTIFQLPAVGVSARAFDVAFHPVGPPPGTDEPDHLHEVGDQRGVSLSRTNKVMVRSAERFCKYGPDEVRSARVDMLIVDQGEPGGATVADALKIPFVSFCNALPLNRDPLIPPPFLHWQSRNSFWARFRNQTTYCIRNRLLSPVFSALNAYRRGWGLPLYRTPDDSFSQLAQFTQLVPSFDFPYEQLPGCFHYVGPYERHSPGGAGFPWHLLDGRDLVYASLGTILGNRPNIWRSLCVACADLNVQVAISLGHTGRTSDYRDLPGNPIVVEYAPQMDVLRRASLLFTHAGLNTVMESLSCGVPMVASPIAFDQPGVAARLTRSGAGEVIRLPDLSPKNLRQRIELVLSDGRYRRNAMTLKEEIRDTRGAAQAADVIERVLETGRPVLRNF